MKQRDAGSEIRADPRSAGGKVADLHISPAVVVPAGKIAFPASKNNDQRKNRIVYSI